MQTPELTLEQQFSLRSFQDTVEQMSADQAKEFLIEMYRQMLIREAMYKALIGHKWDIETPATEEIGDR